jgi:hypothetical protein
MDEPLCSLRRAPFDYSLERRTAARAGGSSPVPTAGATDLLRSRP